MTKLKLTAAGALSAALLVPVAIFAGTGFAQGSASSAEYQYGGGGGKVQLCHKAGKSGKFVTINVSKSAVPAHLRHGDTAGPCVGGSKHHGASKPATTTTAATVAAAPGNSGSHSHGKKK